MDIFCANIAAGITNSRDKLRSLQILSRHGVGLPRTTFVRDKRDVLPAIQRIGGAPVIINSSRAPRASVYCWQIR